MSPMDPPCFADGLVEIIPQDEIVTSEAVVRVSLQLPSSLGWQPENE